MPSRYRFCRLKGLHPKSQRRLVCGAALWLLAACASPVARNLDDSSANRVIAALEQNGISGIKDADPENESKWVVSVPRAEMSSALSVMAREGLPGKEPIGVIESAEHGSLVPSLQTEQARLLAGVAGDLEKSISQLDGVVSVRVHIAALPVDPLAEPSNAQAASASVLIRYNKNYPNLSNEAVQRLIAGAVPNLPAERVTVIATPVASRPVAEHALVPLGPFAVSRGSVWGLRWLVCGFAALNLLLLGQVLLFWRRIRAFRSEPTSVIPAKPRSVSP